MIFYSIKKKFPLLNYISARSSFASRPFKLQSSYPPKTLDNNDQTLSEAGLLNTVIFQRLG